MPGDTQMSQRFIRRTSGWIPISVLLLLAAALLTRHGPAISDNALNIAPPDSEADRVIHATYTAPQ